MHDECGVSEAISPSVIAIPGETPIGKRSFVNE
jgi:hypothetical protein